MSNRVYRMLFGGILLLALYFDLQQVIYGLIAMALLEGVTNQRVPCVVNRLRGGTGCDPNEGSLGIRFHARAGFEAERAWRLLIALVLATSLIIFPETLWFFPWFMGFAILGAGISGVCPMFLALKWAGFK